jgi:Fic family protein
VDVHPFEDGNGRTARLLSTLCLYRAGYDFRRMFTISEHYDSDRPAYYAALRTVRDKGMDLTPWLEYFTGGLAEQMREIRSVGERVIAADLRARQLGLTPRQQLALEYAMERGEITIRDYERLALGTPRRTLQYDLKQLVGKGLLVAEGATHQARYRVRQ